MKIVILVSILSTLLFVKGDIVVDKNLKVNKAMIVYKGADNARPTYCGDRMHGDTISLFLSKGGLAGYTFGLDIIGDKKTVSLFKWSDYPQFDGESSTKLPIYGYKLKINKNVFKEGDTLKATFFVVTNKNKYSDKVKVSGEIYHIIGGNLFSWWGLDNDRNKLYKNGFPKREQVKDSL